MRQISLVSTLVLSLLTTCLLPNRECVVGMGCHSPVKASKTVEVPTSELQESSCCKTEPLSSSAVTDSSFLTKACQVSLADSTQGQSRCCCRSVPSVPTQASSEDAKKVKTFRLVLCNLIDLFHPSNHCFASTRLGPPNHQGGPAKIPLYLMTSCFRC